MDERRKIERFDLRAPAKLEVESKRPDRNVLRLTTRDISSNGAFLYTNQPLPLGSPVRLEFLLSIDFLHRVVGEGRTTRVKVRGNVVRLDEDGIAVAFDSKYTMAASTT